MKVEQFLHANQFHIYGRNEETTKIDILQSYDSKVVEISQNYGCLPYIKLGRDWDYSTTTSKHVYAFLEEYGGIYFDNVSNKRAYINKLIEEGKIKYEEEMY